MTHRFIITAITYLVAGMLPVLIAKYLFHRRFLGGVWAALIVGLIASFLGGLIDTFLLTTIPDLIPIGGVVDAGAPLFFAAVVTILFALVSRSNAG